MGSKRAKLEGIFFITFVEMFVLVSFILLHKKDQKKSQQNIRKERKRKTSQNSKPETRIRMPDS